MVDKNDRGSVVEFRTKQDRIETFMLGILQAEVERKGTGLSIGCLKSAKKLSEQAVAILDGEL